MSGLSSVANYSGRQPDVFQNIKQFFKSTNGVVFWFYKTITGTVYITPSDQSKTVLIPKDLYVIGSITNTSDIKLRQNIEEIDEDEFDRILKVFPKKYSFISDNTNKTHYGLIAQDLETVYPELVTTNHHETDEGKVQDIKSINYVELIPLLICKIQQMQGELDELKIQSGNQGSPNPSLKMRIHRDGKSVLNF
jgi:hypothetical protein